MALHRVFFVFATPNPVTQWRVSNAFFVFFIIYFFINEVWPQLSILSAFDPLSRGFDVDPPCQASLTS